MRSSQRSRCHTTSEVAAEVLQIAGLVVRRLSQEATRRVASGDPPSDGREANTLMRSGAASEAALPDSAAQSVRAEPSQSNSVQDVLSEA